MRKIPLAALAHLSLVKKARTSWKRLRSSGAARALSKHCLSLEYLAMRMHLKWEITIWTVNKHQWNSSKKKPTPVASSPAACIWSPLSLQYSSGCNGSEWCVVQCPGVGLCESSWRWPIRVTPCTSLRWFCRLHLFLLQSKPLTKLQGN